VPGGGGDWGGAGWRIGGAPAAPPVRGPRGRGGFVFVGGGGGANFGGARAVGGGGDQAATAAGSGHVGAGDRWAGNTSPPTGPYAAATCNGFTYAHAAADASSTAAATARLLRDAANRLAVAIHGVCAGRLSAAAVVAAETG